MLEERWAQRTVETRKLSVEILGMWGVRRGCCRRLARGWQGNSGGAPSFPHLEAAFVGKGRQSKVDLPSGVAVVAAILCRFGGRDAEN